VGAARERLRRRRATGRAGSDPGRLPPATEPDAERAERPMSASAPPCRIEPLEAGIQGRADPSQAGCHSAPEACGPPAL